MPPNDPTIEIRWTLEVRRPETSESEGEVLATYKGEVETSCRTFPFPQPLWGQIIKCIAERMGEATVE